MFLQEVTVRKLLILILALGVVPIATAQVALRVYEADGITPFDGSDIMVGSKVALIVSSDANDYWSGGLFIRGQDRALATLSGRDSDLSIRDYTDSHYEDAGDMAKVTAWKDSDIWGFDLYGSDIHAIAGDWFVIDYEAISVGDPNVEFYDYSISWDEPNSLLTFHHVPTRDFNDDEVVDVLDIALLGSYWLVQDCDDPCWCGKTDINADGYVDAVDFGLFKAFWLWGVPPGEDPNQSEPEDPNGAPNVTYSIIDANGLDEITINVNDSITLYVDMTTTNEDVYTFHIEVNISDPNLGSIDNTAYNSGTARILAEPRSEGFDYWGPGIYQEEGIELFGASLGTPMSDGHMASFLYTCNGQGDVTLELINWDSSGTAGLESIIIHQIDPNSQQMMGSGMDEMQEASVDEIFQFLKYLLSQQIEISEVFIEAEWMKFIDGTKEPYWDLQ